MAFTSQAGIQAIPLLEMVLSDFLRVLLPHCLVSARGAPIEILMADFLFCFFCL